MNPRRLMSPRDATAIFDRAVEEHALAVLTFQSADDWQSFKSRFLERDPKGRFFVLDYESVDNETPPTLTPGQYLGISFRQRSRKLLFATVVEAKGHYVLDQTTTVPAIRYRWPDTITELQRRAYHRTPVAENMTLVVSLWPGGLRARGDAQQAALQVATAELSDVSCGGALVRMHQPGPPSWSPNQTLGVELQLPDGRPPILVDALFRGARSDESGVVSAAIQFVGLELTVDGRLVLQRLANSVQRLHRLTLAAERGGRSSEFKL
jgi:c-di-GMP-binding flagellar brake protein YcgR